MRLCKNCGLSMGDTATFCQVCGTLAEPDDDAQDMAQTPGSTPPAQSESEAAPVAEAAPAVEAASPAEETMSPTSGPRTPVDLAAEARRCEKSDPARAAALYRQAIVDRLEADEALQSKAGRRDVQRLFDRLSLVLKRDGRIDEALEEIDAAAYLGLLENGTAGTKARREALARRRASLRRALARD